MRLPRGALPTTLPRVRRPEGDGGALYEEQDAHGQVLQLPGLLFLSLLHLQDCSGENILFYNLFSYRFAFQCTVNIVFDRVGRMDPITRTLQFLVNYIGLDVDIKFWSQHVSFLVIGLIVVTSIRGLLINLTKVKMICIFCY